MISSGLYGVHHCGGPPQPRPGDLMLTELHHQPERALIYALQLAGKESDCPLPAWARYCRWRHAAFFASEYVVLEAPGINGKSHLVPAGEAARGTCLVISPPLSDAQRSRASEVGRTRRDIPYSVASYFSVAAWTRGLHAPMLRRYVESRGNMMCSQLADQCVLDLGFHLFTDGRLSQQVMPAALARVAEQKGWTTFRWTP